MLGVCACLTFPHLLNAREQRAVARPEAPGPAFLWPNRGLLILGLIALCIMIGEGAMADWSAVYLRNTLDTREGLAAAGYAAFSVAMAGGRVIGDWLSRR